MNSVIIPCRLVINFNNKSRFHSYPVDSGLTIKADVSPSTLPPKSIDGFRETKQGMQQRPVTDARSRLNNDSHGFRFDF